ncbi:hypothetical protein A6R68_01180, partial [Neotoma lepida]
GNQKLFPCEVCGRCFAADVLERHGPICEKLFNKKRKPFDSLKQRLQGTDIPTVSRLPKPKVQPRRKSNWRQQHEDFINAIRSAKQCTLAIKEGRPLPPPPPPTINPGFTTSACISLVSMHCSDSVYYFTATASLLDSSHVSKRLWHRLRQRLWLRQGLWLRLQLQRWWLRLGLRWQLRQLWLWRQLRRQLRRKLRLQLRLQLNLQLRLRLRWRRRLRLRLWLQLRLRLRWQQRRWRRQRWYLLRQTS